MKAPKKPPAARTIYFKAKRAEVREGMRSVDGEGATTQAVDEELFKRWGALPPDEVLTYEAQARVEADRYNRELKAYREAQAAQEREASKATAAAHASKKAKHSDAASSSSGAASPSGAAAPPSPTKAPSFSIPKKVKPVPAEQQQQQGTGASGASKP
jgi:hypothetical protein